MKISIFILVIVFIFCFSCEEQGLIVKCADCLSEEPVDTDLEVKLDTGIDGYPRIIKVYEGNLEDSILYSVINVTGSTLIVPVTLNKKFTITATYQFGNSRYTTVDSATPQVKYEKDQCDDPCYYVYDKTINLKLKYTK